MPYTKQTWTDGEAGGTPLSASRLAHMEDGIYDAASGPYLNVMSFGAAGDGTADDTAEIQAALDAIPVNGGVVYFPAGRYKVSSTLRVEKDNTTLMGIGPGSATTGNGVGSRIEAAAGITGSIVRVQHPSVTRPLGGVVVRDLAIDGATLGTSVEGLHFRSYQGLIDNVKIWRCTGDGIWIQGYPSGGGDWATYDTRIRGVLVSSCSQAGVYLSDRGEDLHFTNCILFGNQDGMRLQASSQQVTACHFYDNTRYGVFFDGGGTRTKVVGCKIEGNDGGGMRFDSTNGGMGDILVVGNSFADNFTTNNAQDELSIAGATGVTGVQIVGNNFSNKTGGAAATKARYAINLSTTAAQAVVITGNRFAHVAAGLHFATAAINNAGNTSQYLKAFISGNIGTVTAAGGIVNFGTATIPSGSTSIAVTHGLDYTPNAQDINVVPTNNPTVDPGNVWISTITSTQFTINCRTNPSTTGAIFSWKATL